MAFKTTKTSKNEINKAQLTAAILDLRLKGYTYIKIAKELNISLTTAIRLAKAALDKYKDKIRENVEQLRELELLKLEELQRRIEDKLEKGDLKAIKTYLQISERKARLLGLDAPQKQDITVKTPEPIKFVLEEDGNKSN